MVAAHQNNHFIEYLYGVDCRIFKWSNYDEVTYLRETDKENGVDLEEAIAHEHDDDAKYDPS